MRAELIGQRFGALTVIERVRTTPSGTLWLAACDCGGQRELLTTTLKSAANPGCKNCESDRRSAVHIKHGDCSGPNRGGKTKLYMVWKGMLSRCRDVGNTSYFYYGRKGICVTDVWSSFNVFREWSVKSGYVPGLSIDRLDSGADYSPENCEWVTRGENSRRSCEHRRRMKLVQCDAP